MVRKIAGRLARTKYFREILENPVDSGELRVKRTARLYVGLFLIGLSYVIGWPAVAVLGFLAAYFREPAIVIIGGPAIYGFSYLVFFAGAWLAGAKYANLLIKYHTQTLFKKILHDGAH